MAPGPGRGSEVAARSDAAGDVGGPDPADRPEPAADTGPAVVEALIPVLMKYAGAKSEDAAACLPSREELLGAVAMEDWLGPLGLAEGDWHGTSAFGEVLVDAAVELASAPVPAASSRRWARGPGLSPLALLRREESGGRLAWKELRTLLVAMVSRRPNTGALDLKAMVKEEIREDEKQWTLVEQDVRAVHFEVADRILQDLVHECATSLMES